MIGSEAAIPNPALKPLEFLVGETDGDSKECTMLYFDERGVSRRFAVALRSDQLQWWRDSPGFSQRCTVRPVDGGDRMVGRGELNRGDRWEPDLELTYTRIR